MCRFRCSAAAMFTTAGTGMGSTPWAQRMLPVPSYRHGDDDVLDAQIVQAYGRSGDVHEEFHRADFVKVHGFQRSTVGLCLGLAQNGKDAHGRGAGAVGQIGFVQDVQHLGQPAVYVVMVAVSVFVDMFMVVAMFSLVVVATMPMAVRMSILVMMVVVLVMVVLMHIVCVAALLHPAVQVGHIVVVVLVLGVQYHVKITGVQPGLFHSADVDAEPIQRQAGQRFAQHSLVRAPRSNNAAVTISPLMPE